MRGFGNRGHTVKSSIIGIEHPPPGKKLKNSKTPPPLNPPMKKIQCMYLYSSDSQYSIIYPSKSVYCEQTFVCTWKNIQQTFLAANQTIFHSLSLYLVSAET